MGNIMPGLGDLLKELYNPWWAVKGSHAELIRRIKTKLSKVERVLLGIHKINNLRKLKVGQILNKFEFPEDFIADFKIWCSDKQPTDSLLRDLIYQENPFLQKIKRVENEKYNSISYP